MRDPDFKGLAEELLNRGIGPRIANRTVDELRDHYDDLVDEAVDSGASRKQARDAAAERLGELNDVAVEMASRRELKTWSFRYPRVAVVVYPLACLALLPAMPVFVGIAHKQSIMRWGVSLLGAGVVTAAMMLVMQLSIIFGSINPQ